MLSTLSPFPNYFDLDGSPLDAGALYFGQPNQNPETAPVTVYWDAAGTQPAAQPIATVNGYTVRAGTPAIVYAAGDYSLSVRNRRGQLVYYARTSANSSNASALQDQLDRLGSSASAADGAGMVAHDPALSYAAGTVGAKLAEFVSPEDFGAAGDGVTDDTAELQAAMDRAATLGVPLRLAGKVYGVSASGAYALTAPASVEIFGVQGATEIKLLSSSGACAIIGRGTASTFFRMEGVTLNGNKAAVSAVNVKGLSFAEAGVIISRHNTYKNMNDTGALAAGQGIYADHSTVGGSVVSSYDTWSGNEGYAVQTYRVPRVTIEHGYASGQINTFADVNSQTIPSETTVKQTFAHNTVICDASFPAVNSVFSLLGNDVSCIGNKVYGGGTQIVVHDGTTEALRNYVVSGNLLWSAKSAGVFVNQTSGASATNGNVSVIGNTVYQSEKDGIAVVGTYAGSGDMSGTVTISGNTIIDNRTENPAPGAYACIRTLGAVNVSINGNSMEGPRWAGIYCEYDGRNISIVGNTITDHQGRTTTGSGGSTPEAGGAIFIGASNATAYLGSMVIASNVISNYGTQVSPQASFVRTGAIVVNEPEAQDILIEGNLIKTGNTSGIALFDCVNVTARDNTVTGFFGEALKTSSGVGAGCLLTNAINASRFGTTANRPTLQSTQGGYSYWDTSLNIPIWWNGTVWKNASNGTV